jgi:hypothetical protein
VRSTFVFIFVFLSFCSLIAQKPDRDQFIRDSTKIMRPKLARPQFKFDNRLTWYKGQTLLITGFDLGVLLKDKMRLTLGYYKLNEDLNALRKTLDTTSLGAIVNINYAAINTEFIYLNTRFFSLGMPLEIGLGQNELTYKNFSANEVYRKNSGFILLTYFGLSATFKPIRWIGLKGIVGYRKTVFNQVKEFDFDGAFTSLGLNIDFQEIIRDIKMIRLEKKYKRGNNVSNAVDIITD